MQDHKTSVLPEDDFVLTPRASDSNSNDCKDPSDSLSLFQEIDVAIHLLDSTEAKPKRVGRKGKPKSVKREIPSDKQGTLFEKEEFGGDAAPKREKVRRRRQIDPTTCERDYSLDEVEFMNALDDYKRSSGRMFPTCSEILEVIRSLGYVKMPKSSAENGTSFATMTATPLSVGTPALLDESRGESEEIVTIFWKSEETTSEMTPIPAMEDYPDFDYREPLLIF